MTKHESADTSASITLDKDPATQSVSLADAVSAFAISSIHGTLVRDHVVDELSAPSVPTAPWLADVQRRLMNSIGVPLDVERSGGRWLPREVVAAANSFFLATSDLLPSSFTFYDSKGDLIAEIESTTGRH